jgi:hypothetical protein
MKKYLIQGALALVASTTIISCHSDVEFSDSLISTKLKTYEEVFKEEFGEINSTQDWGFGAANQMARLRAAKTRAISIENAQAGANTEKNLWGDPNQYNLQIPPALTEGQKERVRKYFQTHTPLTYVDPGYENFFIQQVYKGGTSPANNPIMGQLTQEEYVMADANFNNGVYDKTVGSDHMDYLTVGLDENGNCLHHVNDFNNGEWNHGTTIDVLNEGASTNDYEVPGNTHPDQITLVLNSNTQRVGYANSTGSIQHNYACALVNPKLIDDWANSQDPVIGENVYYNVYENGELKINNQKWNRSFVGLDFESNDPYLYDDNGNKVPAKVGDVMNSVVFAWDGDKYYILNDIKDKTLKEQLNLSSEVYYLQTDVSKYAGTPSHLSGQSALISQKNKDNIIAGLKANGYSDETIDAIPDFNSQMWGIDLNVIRGKITENCQPVTGKGLVDWIKDADKRGRDYVYSDWIVTLTKAVEQGHNDPEGTVIPIEPGLPGGDKIETWIKYRYKRQLNSSGRILCEDLGVIRASDIDFNDIVFDAYIYDMIPYKRTIIKKNDEDYSDTGWVRDYDHSSDAYRFADIFVLAGGGTLQTTVAGQNFKSLWGSEIGNGRIINTIDEEVGSYGNAFTNNNDFGKILDYRMGNNEGLIDIPIVVKYENYPLLLTANPGVAPHKICVPIEKAWPFERIEIKEAYPNFSKYVGSRGSYSVDENQKNKVIYNPDECWNNPVNGKIYVGDGEITHIKYSSFLRTAASDDSDVSNESYFDESIPGLTDYYYKEDGGSNSGYHTGDPVLVRKRH